MKILITGGSGYIGSRLIAVLLAAGHEVIALSRRPDALMAGLSEDLPATLPRGAELRAVSWPTMAAEWDELAGIDAVVNLAGESVAQRWTPAVKAEIRSSRVELTHYLISNLGLARIRPRVFVSASGTGFYGNRDPNEQLDEAASQGLGELAILAGAWEDAARRAAPVLDARPVLLRIGPVVGPGAPLLRKVGPWPLGPGRVGSGRQIVPWVHVDDVIAMILWALREEGLFGPVNCAAPWPVSQDELASTIRLETGRPIGIPIPEAVAFALMGDAAELVAFGQRAIPRKATGLGFEFVYPLLLGAVIDAVRKERRA